MPRLCLVRLAARAITARAEQPGFLARLAARAATGRRDRLDGPGRPVRIAGRSSRWWLAALLALSFALRVGAACWWQSRLADGERFRFGDSASYWVLGQAIHRGEPYQYGSRDASIFRMPGYPAILAALFRAAGEDVPVIYARFMGAAWGTLAVATVYLLARQTLSRPQSLLAAALASVYPGAVGLSILVLSEAPFCPLMIAHLWAWSASWRAVSSRSGYLWSALAGLLAGLATLVKPSWLAFVPWALAAGLLWQRSRWRHFRLGLCMCGALAITLCPWWIRNARVVGHFVPTTLQVGASLYDGLNPHANGGSNMSFVPGMELLERQRDAIDPEPFEYRLDARLRREALSWAAEHPARVAQLVGIKFQRLWNVWPNEPEHRNPWLRLAVLSTYAPLLGLGLAGAWKFRRAGWCLALCWLPAVYLTLLHVVFVSSIRYREPAMLALIVPAAQFLGSLRSSRA